MPLCALSLTPVPLGADMRAVKIAHSLHRLGFESLIQAADMSEPLPITAIDPAAVSSYASPQWRKAGFVQALRHGKGGWCGDALLFALFTAEHVWRYNWKLRRSLPPADLYYLHSFEYYAVVPETAAMIYDAHDFYQGIHPDDLLPRFDRVWIKPFLRAQEEQCIARADAMATVSGNIADLLEASYGLRPCVLRNTHDARLEQPAPQSLRARLSLKSGDRLIVMAGNYKKNIDFDLARAVLDLLPDHVHLAFVGRGYEAAEAERAGGRRMHFAGGVAATQVVPYLREADLGWLIYRTHSVNSRHALPNGFFQLMAAGLPVIYPDITEINALVGDAPIGCAMKGLTEQALAAAIMALLAAPDTARQAVAALAVRHGWDQDEMVLRDLVETVMQERKRK